MVSETDQKSWNVEVLTQFHNGENPLEVQRVMNEHPGLGDTPFKQPPEFTRRILYNLYPGQHDTSPWEEFLMRNHTPPYISSTPEVTHYPLDPSPELLANILYSVQMGSQTYVAQINVRLLISGLVQPHAVTQES
ncbi:hypothetical protein BDR07DRAFT_1614003 [Suillus spraguei]|nr:hypothetical protein BDR07DRAFT_1614003 [Suillus spraguei]